MKAAPRSRLLLLAAAATVLVVDQASKLWVVSNLPAYTPVDWIPWLRPVLSFTYVKNTGVAFGLFPGLGPLFSLLAVAVVIGILAFHRAISPHEHWVHLALGLVMGGALGNNIIDRPLRGFVVDFFDVNFWPFRDWPIFNVADSAIVVGVAILLLDSLLQRHEEMSAAELPPAFSDAMPLEEKRGHPVRPEGFSENGEASYAGYDG